MEVITIPNFYYVNPLQRIKINRILEYNYKKNYNERKGFNYRIDSNDKFFVNLYDKFLESCKSIFHDFELSPTNSRSCWCYRSKEDDYKSIFHNHARTSTINAVYYYQVELGDSITFLMDNEQKTLHVSKNELVIFPNYLVHKPDKPAGKKCRYSINIEIQTVRPVCIKS
jgi:hypothetical protein|tara:strand:- start:311 stop:820 length:510 start_codon:yes stop_codon:yes gene_type:complete